MSTFTAFNYANNTSEYWSDLNTSSIAALRPTWLLAVVLFHALQALQQVVHLVFDLRELSLDGLQVIHLHCGRTDKSSWARTQVYSCHRDTAVAPTRTGGPLAALGGGEAGFGSSAPPSAQADPRTLRGNDGAGQGRRRRRHPGLVGVHPEIQRCKKNIWLYYITLFIFFQFCTYANPKPGHFSYTCTYNNKKTIVVAL